MYTGLRIRPTVTQTSQNHHEFFWYASTIIYLQRYEKNHLRKQEIDCERYVHTTVIHTIYTIESIHQSIAAPLSAPGDGAALPLHVPGWGLDRLISFRIYIYIYI